MKSLSLPIFILLTASILISCGGPRMAGTSANEDAINWYAVDDGTSNTDKIERKVLYTADISLVVANPDTSNVKVVKIARKYNGYVTQLGTYGTTIRVESSKLDDAIDDLSELGKLKRKNMSGQDLTEEFMDHQIRLENAEKARVRYLELLAKAENVEAALKVEKELERLNETIDLLKGKMNRINHLSEFSTIVIFYYEKKKPGLLGYIGMGLYYSVKWLFVRN